MKRKGILNRQLLELLSCAGHGDMIAVTDRGFPIPRNACTQVIDLGVVPGVPSFGDVLFPLIEELVIEGYILAEETFDYNKTLIDQLHMHPAIKGVREITEKIVPHAEFKEMVLSTNSSSAPIAGFIRTGEFTKYTNIILICGVAF